MGKARSEVERLRFYGRPGDHELLEWTWVENQLKSAGTYWINTNCVGYPHPRPVWGIWFQNSLILSIGSPKLVQLVETDPDVTVHLESGTDVVVVEGVAQMETDVDAAVLGVYNTKYEWNYTYDEYGPLTRVNPKTILSWRSTGWAGRDGIQESGRWRFS